MKRLNELDGKDAGELKDYFEYLKDEVLKENDFLSKKIDDLEVENHELKLQVVELDQKDKLLDKMKQDLNKVRANRNNMNQLNTETAMYISENKRLVAEKDNFYYLIQEIIKYLKKKKGSQVKNALSMLADKDEEEVKKIFKSFKLKY